MEEKLRKFVEAGSPDTSREVVMSKICRNDLTNIVQSDYLLARTSGLTIAEANHALLLAQEIRTLGIEAILARVNAITTPKTLKSANLKRKRRRDEEPDLKKRAKF